MALPDLIEIVPLDKPVRAEITVPGSKSITNRALILAALADGEVTLTGALWSEDTQVMTEALRTLGFDVRVENDPAEFCNRTITVQGQGGKIPKAGTAEKPLELFVGNAGTAARFLAAMVCLGGGVYRLSGVPRMHERPQAALFIALRELGYRVDATGDKLPAVIFGAGRGCVADQPQQCGTAAADASRTAALRSCTVSIEESSQFASALLLSAKHGGWEVKWAGDDDEEAPYVTMTEKLLEAFPWSGGKFQIEPDASSGSYFWAAGMFDMISTWKPRGARNEFGSPEFLSHQLKDAKPLYALTVRNWPESGWQIDSGFPIITLLTTSISRMAHLGDSIMTSMILAPFSNQDVVFRDLHRLRLQECERVAAMKAELTKCGAVVVEDGEMLKIQSALNLNILESAAAFCSEKVSRLLCNAKLHGAEIETYNDHRMAMCFAILGLKVPGIRLKNPSCVKKTFPNFFQKLAAAPPNGLGVEIWEVKDGKRTRKLEGEDLFAD